MTAMILDERMTERLIAERQALGLDDHDECWDGVYVMPPAPSSDHQRAVFKLARVLSACRPTRRDQVIPGVNISPEADDWERNYRVPDIAVVLAGNPLVDHGSYIHGGPDLVVEMRSRGDDSYRKLDFYTALGVREVLVVERDTRRPVLFRLGRKKLTRVKPTAIDGGSWLTSVVLDAAFAHSTEKGKPKLLVRRTTGAARTWRV